MKKFILFLFMLIVLFVVGGFFYIDTIVKAGIENIVPMVTKTTAKVESVKIALFKGEISIKNLEIGNPEGFTTPTIFSLGEITILFDKNSLSTNTVVINKVVIDNVSATYERKDGRTNINVIQDNVNSFLGKNDNAGSQEAVKVTENNTSESNKNLVIDELYFTNSKVNANVGGKEVAVNIPNIHLKDIGKGGNMSFSKAFAEVVNKFSTEVLNEFANSTTDLLKGAGEALKLKSEDLKENLKELFK